MEGVHIVARVSSEQIELMHQANALGMELLFANDLPESDILVGLLPRISNSNGFYIPQELNAFAECNLMLRVRPGFNAWRFGPQFNLIQPYFSIEVGKRKVRKWRSIHVATTGLMPYIGFHNIERDHALMSIGRPQKEVFAILRQRATPVYFPGLQL